MLDINGFNKLLNTSFDNQNMKNSSPHKRTPKSVNACQPKLSAKQESDICLSCGECCKRYWITVLPQEAKVLAKSLRMGEKEFLEEKCVLFVKLFPKSTPGLLTIPTAFFPKRIYELLEKEMVEVPQSFFVVPQIVLKRERGECVLLGAGNKCSAYKTRPEPCRLFPFIAVAGLREQYPFCPLFHKTFKDSSKESRAYYKKVQKYFKSVHAKGFFGAKGVWKHAPQKGSLLLNEKALGEISLGELEDLLSITRKNNKA